MNNMNNGSNISSCGDINDICNIDFPLEGFDLDLLNLDNMVDKGDWDDFLHDIDDVLFSSDKNLNDDEFFLNNNVIMNEDNAFQQQTSNSNLQNQDCYLYNNNESAIVSRVDQTMVSNNCMPHATWDMNKYTPAEGNKLEVVISIPDLNTPNYALTSTSVGYNTTGVVFKVLPTRTIKDANLVIPNPQPRKRKEIYKPLQICEDFTYDYENIKTKCSKYSDYDPYPENPDLLELDAIFKRKRNNSVVQVNKIKKPTKTETRTQNRQPLHEKNAIEKRVERDFEYTARIPFYSSFIEKIRVRKIEQDSYGTYKPVKLANCKKSFLVPTKFNAHEKYCM